MERGRRRAGVYAIIEVLGQHVNAVYRIRSSYPVENSQLLSTRIGAQRTVPDTMRSEVAGLHDRIASIIAQIAAVIEGGKYAEAELAVQQLGGGYLGREGAESCSRRTSAYTSHTSPFG